MYPACENFHVHGKPNLFLYLCKSWYNLYKATRSMSIDISVNTYSCLPLKFIIIYLRTIITIIFTNTNIALINIICSGLCSLLFYGQTYISFCRPEKVTVLILYEWNILRRRNIWQQCFQIFAILSLVSLK